MMDTNEVLEVFGSGVVLGPAGVHPLDNGCHVAKDQRMHQRCRYKEGEQKKGKGRVRQERDNGAELKGSSREGITTGILDAILMAEAWRQQRNIIFVNCKLDRFKDEKQGSATTMT